MSAASQEILMIALAVFSSLCCILLMISIYNYKKHDDEKVNVYVFRKYRIILITFFWLSFITYLIVEALHSTFHFVAGGSTLILPSFLQTPLGFLGFQKGVDSVILWFFHAFMLASVVMFPFALSYRLTSRRFKVTALKAASQLFDGQETLKFVNFSPSVMLPRNIVLQMTGNHEKAKEWINRAFSHSSGWRFDVSSHNQDLMCFKRGGVEYEFWETYLDVEVEKYSNAGKGSSWVTVCYEKMFDGICVHIRDIFKEDNKTKLIFTSQDDVKKVMIPVRNVIYYSGIPFFKSKPSKFSRNCMLEKGNSSFLEFECTKIVDMDIAKIEDNIQFVAVSGRDLYVFVHTGVDGNFFEFHLSYSVKQNMEIFEQDLAYIGEKIKSVEKALAYLNGRGDIHLEKVVG